MFGNDPTEPPAKGVAERHGYSVLEALVAILLTALAVQAAWSVVAHQGRAARVTMDRLELLEVRRTVRWILEEELRVSNPGEDWRLHGPDSISLRAFRGTGLLCPPGVGRVLTVVGYEGHRLPNPEKDSVLVLGEDGRWVVVDLISRATSASPCPTAPALPVELWTVSDSLAGGALARVFERGAYHLVGQAFRYSRGAGGRQPLTPLRLVSEESGFGSLSGGVQWRLTTELPEGRRPHSGWEGALRALEREE